LSDIRDAFARRGNQERAFTAELLEDLHDRDDRPWDEDGKSAKPLTPQALSRIQGPCSTIYSRSQRGGDEKRRRYQRSDFLEAWERCLASETTTTKTANEPTEEKTDEPAPENSVPTGTVSQPNPVSDNKNAPCLNVSVRKRRPEVERREVE